MWKLSNMLLKNLWIRDKNQKLNLNNTLRQVEIERHHIKFYEM
jgi:hypothetical protein